MDIKTNSIPSLNVSKMVNTLSLMYSNTINKHISLDVLPSVMMWGQPGVGKSQSVREIAKNIELNTNKHVFITDVRLILFNPVDLRGIPTTNQDKTLAVWLKPKIFDMDKSDSVINILFLDELSSCSQSVQAAAYQITLDKKVGEHELPKNCIVIAAGNRTVDKSVSFNMPKALANRLLHLEVESDFKSWNEWAVKSKIHPYVIGFLNFRSDLLNTFNPKEDSLAFATPRSWEMVSNILNTVSDDLSIVYNLICGLVGRGVASEFRTYTKIYSKLPNIENIFKGIERNVPTEVDVIYALISRMVSFASEKKNDFKAIDNSLSYAMKLPPDFQVVLLKDYMYIEPNYKNKLLTNSYAFREMISKRGKLIDESI